MFRIMEARDIGFRIRQFTIEAPRIAHKQRPGQFVIVRLHDQGERIPLSIKSSDPAAGTITIVVQSVGKTTSLLNSLEAGDSILDIMGPLGQPSEIKIHGTAVIVAGGMDTATALPTARALRDAGNFVVFIEGARNREMVLFEDELRKAVSETHILTDDNSYGERGPVTNKLNELIANGRKIDYVLAVGSIGMMRAVAAITAPRGIKTTVSLKTIMMDGAGMFGGCRVLAGGDTKFACVDGPEFDATLVNFDLLMQRNARYRDKESMSLEVFAEHKEEQLVQCRAELAEHKRAELESTYAR